MSNDIKLQSPEGKHPVDENLRPILVGDKLTAIETASSGNGARVSGDLEVSGSLHSHNINHDNVTGDIALYSNKTGAVIRLDCGGGIEFYNNKIDENIKYLDLTIGNNILFAGLSPIEIRAGQNDDLTLTSRGIGNILIDSAGDIDISSDDGNFIMRKGDTEFSAANSAYAGMILGYTEMAYGTTSGRYDTTTSFVVVNDNYDHGDGAEDHFLGVTFVVPPSNRVEIEVFLPYVSGADGNLYLGLATDTSATTLKAKFEVVVWDVDETDIVQIVQRWIIDGSDSGLHEGAWSAGESKTIYCMVKEGTAGGRLFWGDSFLNYGDMSMKATALPTTIGDGT